MLEAAEQTLDAAAALERAAVSESDKDEVDGPHGAVHTAGLAEDGVSDFVAGLNADTVVQHVEDVAQGAGAVDVGGLEDDHEDRCGGDGGGNADQAGHTQDAHHDNNDDGNEQNRGDIEGTAERVLNALSNSGIVGAGVNVQAEDGVDDQGDDEGRAGGGDHRGDVVEKTGLGNSRGKVGGIGQGGELIADIRAGDDHTGGDGGRDAEARADAEERKTDGGGGGPGGAARHTDDRAEDAADGQEQLRGQQVKAVDDQGRDRAGGHEAGDEETDGAEDQNGFHGSCQTIDHTGEHILEGMAAGEADDAGDDDGQDQGHVRVMITGFGMTEEAIKHEPDHCHNGDQRQNKTGLPCDFLFVCHLMNTSLFIKILARHRSGEPLFPQTGLLSPHEGTCVFCGGVPQKKQTQDRDAAPSGKRFLARRAPILNLFVN